MDEFEGQNQQNGQFGNQQRPDYYQPNNSSTYYTPPQSEKPPVENTTYHYSYVKPDEQNSNQSFNGSYYTPPQSDNYTGYNQGNNNDNKPPKKSKAAIVIIIVLIACLVIAGIGLVIGTTGIIENKSDNEEEITASQNEADVELKDSEEVPLKNSTSGDYTVAGVYKENVDSCVGITVYTQQASSYYYFYGYGQNDNSNGSPAKSGEGSGVIMSEANGKTYIITCAHVISDADSFTVTLNDATEYDATLVGFDAQTDIGVLSIDETGLKVAEFADSEKLIVGEQVVAIGCPGGLEFKNSATSGYISALDRPISSTIGYDTKCIQIDAAINPGNSGGALFNMQGQIIGINSSKIASTEYEGMGFAVPSKTAVETANSLIRVGYVEGRAKIGITYNPITSFNNSKTIINALAEKGYKNAEGAMVINEVDSSSDLAGKDIKQYDMIVAVNGDVLTSTDVMTSVLSDSKPGDKITLTIARIENNEIKISDVECKLIEAK